MSAKFDRHYAKLDHQERLVAVVAALARADDDETDKLYRQCPRRRYDEPDTAFTDRVKATQIITYGLVFELSPLLRALLTLNACSKYVAFGLDDCVSSFWTESMRSFSAGAQWGWHQAGKEGPPPFANEDADDDEEGEAPIASVDTTSIDETRDNVAGHLAELCAEVATRARAAWDGFDLWASAQGLDPRLLVGAFAGFLEDELVEAEPLLEAATPDDEAAEALSDLCAAMWKKWL